MSTSENKFSRCLLQISTHHLKEQICEICGIRVSIKFLRYLRFLREVKNSALSAVSARGKKFCAICGFCERNKKLSA